MRGVHGYLPSGDWKPRERERPGTDLTDTRLRSSWCCLTGLQYESGSNIHSQLQWSTRVPPTGIGVWVSALGAFSIRGTNNWKIATAKRIRGF